MGGATELADQMAACLPFALCYDTEPESGIQAPMHPTFVRRGVS